MSNIEKLIQIFKENRDKRICVLGTTCTGKTTLIHDTNMGLDMLSTKTSFISKLSKEEIKYVCQTPWTLEIGNKMNELVRTKLSIKPGIPMFGTVLLDCDLIVYLHINDELLRKRTKLRNANFNDAKNMQQKIEQEIKRSNKPTIVIEVQNENRR